MADFESIVKSYVNAEGFIPADAIAKLAKAISTTVGNEFVDKERYRANLPKSTHLKQKSRPPRTMQRPQASGKKTMNLSSSSLTSIR